jgi:hypothetical protein
MEAPATTHRPMDVLTSLVNEAPAHNPRPQDPAYQASLRQVAVPISVGQLFVPQPMFDDPEPRYLSSPTL